MALDRKLVPAVTDVVAVDDAAAIHAVNGHPLIDRELASIGPLGNRLVVLRTVRTLAFGGHRFPGIVPKAAPGARARQAALWDDLTARAEALASGPPELEPIAAIVRGDASTASLGVQVQTVVGRLFEPTYEATAASWQAAVTFDTASRSSNPWRLARWWLGGDLERARTLLARMVGGRLDGVHATGLAMHNIVNSLLAMRALYADAQQRESLDASAAGTRCLRGPRAVLRQASADGEVAGCPFRRGTLFVLGIAAAMTPADPADIAFLRGSWSQCPAERWVPALLEGTWQRARATER